ncbi:hypothetical protein MAR_013247 [Mya arenaria]|uniref:Uncharacterized protein n=1 Tax=Mya arenaria TaxID=6604 RepID=A0ABY7FZA8_MYAAR|nr:hypothetical protein MAR_013247 [Mya arenaria]
MQSSEDTDRFLPLIPEDPVSDADADPSDPSDDDYLPSEHVGWKLGANGQKMQSSEDTCTDMFLPLMPEDPASDADADPSDPSDDGNLPSEQLSDSEVDVSAGLHDDVIHVSRGSSGIELIPESSVMN